MRTKDPQEQFGDPIIFANGQQVGRSVPGIAFDHDFPPGTYAFTVQSYGLTAGQPVQRDTLQLAPGTQSYLEVLWGRQLASGYCGRCDLLCANAAPLGPAYVKMLSDQGPPRPYSPAARGE